MLFIGFVLLRKEVIFMLDKYMRIVQDSISAFFVGDGKDRKIKNS